jgi:hypothetical protein
MDSLAVPLYDVFDPKPDNADPYTAVPPNIPLDERNTESSPGAAASRRMDFGGLDRVSQQDLDGVLWKSVHGQNAVPPPPGPNASGQDETDSD